MEQRQCLCRGNGCCTYVKKAWLDKAGIDASKVKDVQMDFNTYYGYLKQMAQTMGHYVISSPGFIHPEAPNTNYLPEFYQKKRYCGIFLPAAKIQGGYPWNTSII